MAQDLRLKRTRTDISKAGPRGKKRRVEPDFGSDAVDDVSASEESDGPDDVGMQQENDEEEWDGFASGDEEPSQTLERRPKGGSANKPPTRDELRSIKEASNLYRSNTFKLAIDALLPNVRPKESRLKPLEEFLRLLYTTLMSLASTPPSHPLEAARSLERQGIAVPYAAPQPTEETAWKVVFEKPSDIVIVGSWATKTGVKSPSNASWTVDVAVEMPANLYQEKDYLDNRFFHKRAYYLASLALAIRSEEKLRVDTFYDSPSDLRLTSLTLTPRSDGSSIDFSKLNACVRILPILPSPSPVSLHHLSPSHCNLRVKVSATDANTLTGPTPVYNSDLLMCASARGGLLRTHELVQEVSSLRDALALLRVWANQWGYSLGPKEKGIVAGFDGRGYFWTAVMHATISGEEPFGKKVTKGLKRSIGRRLSSYQLFRAALDFLATHDFSSEPFFVRGGTRFCPDTYTSQSAGFVDNCSVNLLAGVPTSSLDLLRRDARVTLDVLNSSSVGAAVDPFDEVFLHNRRQLSTRFDVVICVDLRRASLRKTSLLETFDHGSQTQFMVYTLSTLLRRALSDRVHAVGILLPMRDLRPLSQGNASIPLAQVHVGLTLNTENAFRLVDHGPVVTEQDSQEAIEFRELWGDKAELRRFKDGRILESVVWEAKSADARARIPADIVCHILSRHLGLGPERDIRTFQKDFDVLLRVPDHLAQRVVLPGAQPGFKSAMAAFDDLVRQLKSLDEEIPLAILNVSPVASELRYASVFTPIPIPPKNAASLASSMRYLFAMEIVVQFERSTRWPDDLVAIQKMKLAFFEQMANALMARVPGLRASIVTSTQQTTLANFDNSYLEIVTPEGWGFAAWIWHGREETLLRRILDKKKLPIANGALSTLDNRLREQLDRQAASRAYELYARRYLHAPKHHRAIANLCHMYSAFPSTVRLVKRWFSIHWIFEGHVSGEAIELLCAHVFVGSSTGGLQSAAKGRIDVPGTKELGFFRVLVFLKEWSWESGLFVSLYETDESSEEEDGTSVHTRAGSGVWSISTSEDRSGRVWTAEGPDALAARRIKSLASAGINYVLKHEREGFSPKILFLHPTNDYDLLIRLRPEMLCRTHQSLDTSATAVTKYVNIPASSSEDSEPLRVGFDPASMFYNDLKRIYLGTLAFFFDSYGGNVIGAVWDPSLLAERPFRVLADYSTLPSETDEKRKRRGMVVLNQAAVLAEIQRLGEGIVKSIEVLRTH